MKRNAATDLRCWWQADRFKVLTRLENDGNLDKSLF